MPETPPPTMRSIPLEKANDLLTESRHSQLVENSKSEVQRKALAQLRGQLVSELEETEWMFSMHSSGGASHGQYTSTVSGGSMRFKPRR